MDVRTTVGVALAGALGASCRVAISQLPLFAGGHGMQIATIACNLLGSLLLGWFLYALVDEVSVRLRTIVATGFLGAFTTFSAISIDAVRLLDQGSFGWFSSYIALTIVGGLGAAWLGYWLASIRKPKEAVR